MAKEYGFLQLRRGLWEHVRDGRMSITEALAFIYICSEADTRTGIWKGCAKSLSGELGIPERTARDVLEKMEHGDYIRRFAVPGQHSCYPILVHKFTITQGERNGEQLNALDSSNPADLAYFSREQSVEQDVEQGVEHSAAQKRIENREQRRKKNTSAKTAPPADPRYRPFFDVAYQSFQAKHGGKAPSWTGRDHKSLKILLASNTTATLDDLCERWRNYLTSTELFTVKQGDSLAYFCSKVDTFISGPIREKGKSDAQNALARTVADSPLDASGRLPAIVH